MWCIFYLHRILLAPSKPFSLNTHNYCITPCFTPMKSWGLLLHVKLAAAVAEGETFKGEQLKCHFFQLFAPVPQSAQLQQHTRICWRLQTQLLLCEPVAVQTSHYKHEQQRRTETLNTFSWQLVLPSGAPRVPAVKETPIFCCCESSIYYWVDWSWLSHCYCHIIKFWFHTTNLTFYPFCSALKSGDTFSFPLTNLLFINVHRILNI